MKLIFIRHGDPDYTCDGLTEKGVNEAVILSKHIKSFITTEIPPHFAAKGFLFHYFHVMLHRQAAIWDATLALLKTR